MITFRVEVALGDVRRPTSQDAERWIDTPVTSTCGDVDRRITREFVDAGPADRRHAIPHRAGYGPARAYGPIGAARHGSGDRKEGASRHDLPTGGETRCTGAQVVRGADRPLERHGGCPAGTDEHRERDQHDHDGCQHPLRTGGRMGARGREGQNGNLWFGSVSVGCAALSVHGSIDPAIREQDGHGLGSPNCTGGGRHPNRPDPLTGRSVRPTGGGANESSPVLVMAGPPRWRHRQVGG